MVARGTYCDGFRAARAVLESGVTVDHAFTKRRTRGKTHAWRNGYAAALYRSLGYGGYRACKSDTFRTRYKGKR